MSTKMVEVVCARYPGHGDYMVNDIGHHPLIGQLWPLGQNRRITRNSIRLKSMNIVIETGAKQGHQSKTSPRASIADVAVAFVNYWAQKKLHVASPVFQWLFLQSSNLVAKVDCRL